MIGTLDSSVRCALSMTWSWSWQRERERERERARERLSECRGVALALFALVTLLTAVTGAVDRCNKHSEHIT